MQEELNGLNKLNLLNGERLLLHLRLEWNEHERSLIEGCKFLHDLF